jgi:FPC/CPF motif-containing protein YcgG
MMRCARLVIALIFLSISAGQMRAAESLDESIKFLLDYVAKSDATFIRNGQKHTPQEAVNHVKAKYEHFKSEIKTPEDFIRLAASKSLLTGKPYLVRAPDGKEMRLDVWLTEALKQYRTENHQ